MRNQFQKILFHFVIAGYLTPGGGEILIINYTTSLPDDIICSPIYRKTAMNFLLNKFFAIFLSFFKEKKSTENFLFFFNLTLTDRWYFGAWMCDAWLSIDYCASTASIFNLFVLSLDRYWSITSPLKYLRRRTKKRAFLMIAAAWTLSLLWILPVTGWSSMTDGIKLNSSPDSCDTEFADNITFKVSSKTFCFQIIEREKRKV
ncbi:hypothetical protein GHT06_021234 [Daphnia sinensis]|uniref:G-protein coupled receptors family 1 profile domain-containing protein n=1 Tax=Daphnia sinensis TaxID=1820382 RepID=A0AAD5PMR2_9CRUS|nr:hypothetical protein GHT06_021234 [Daphnia sinensis]